jgi:SNF2 family DNA or RNA helicase
MQIVDDKALLFVTKKADQIVSLIPKSKIVERNGDKARVLVNWGEDEAKILRNLRIKDVPHPILGKYKWPGMFTPFAHQKTTSAFLATHPRAFVFNSPGTGKTNSAAWAADYLMERGAVKRVLVICPVSIMDTAWRADLFRTLMHRTVAIASGDRRRRIKVIEGDYDFVIINYDGVSVVQKELIEGGFDLVICDEASALKSVQTDRWKSVAALLTPTTRLWLMTGTPASQSPFDAYGLAKLVNPSSVPNFPGRFKDMVMIKVTQYRWVPRPEAQEIVYQTLQPAIRFTKEECLDLPDLLFTTREVPMTPQQKKFYEKIRIEMAAQAAGAQITAVNAAGLLNKLLQIACIAYNTPVLTAKGWVPIQNVRLSDRIWDGEEFVAHDGLVDKGRRDAVECHGVLMTPEHKVLTRSGWRTAKEINDGDARERFDRYPVRLPDSGAAVRYEQRNGQESDMALPLRLRERSCEGESVFAYEVAYGSEALRMSAREYAAWDVRYATTSYLVQYAASLRSSYRQGLEELRGAWDSRLRAMVRFVRPFLGGHGEYIPRRLNVGSDRQQSGIQQRELPLGYSEAAGKQHARQSHAGYAARAYDAGSGGNALQDSFSDTACTAVPVRMAARESSDNAGAVAVYDIANCGPRNRFVVQGRDGLPLIVHNCGSVYSVDREVVEFDIKPRMQELLTVIEQTSEKVIVFVPFRHVLERVQDELLKAKISAVTIHGGTPAGQRATYIKQFQTEDDPKVILLIPQAAAHGVTLTRADTVVWWGPVPSAELYLQGNSRAHRAGQRHPVTVVRLQGSPVEQRMYTLLDSKLDLHQILVDLYAQEIA